MGQSGGVRDRLMVLDELAGMRRNVNRHVAPPSWQPGLGALRPILLGESQRLAFRSVAFAASALCLAGLLTGPLSGTGDYFSVSVIGVPSLAGMLLGTVITSRRRGRAPAVRWLPPDTPVRRRRFYSGYLVLEVVLAVAAAAGLTAGLPRASFIGPLGYAVLTALIEIPVRQRWSKTEAVNGGALVRASARHHVPGTSGLYFLPSSVAASEPVRRTGRVDVGNPYRSL